MKIWVMIIRDYNEGELDVTSIRSFTSEESAKKAFEDTVEEVHEYWLDNEPSCEDKTEDSYSVYIDGEYCINHTDVWYEEIEVED